jgi:outer membrane protein OmpA-like peptidoglycan-associated protein
MASRAPAPARYQPVSHAELALKLVTGVAGTSLLAAMAWQVARAPLLSDLGVRTAEVMMENGITDGRVQWQTPGGWTWRVARLSGTADAATRERTRVAVAALSGVNDAQWVVADTAQPDAPTVTVDAADRLDLAVCQKRIDMLLDAEAIDFEANNATITVAAVRQVDALAQTLQRCPEARAAITDRSPSAGGNAIAQALSQARADAVASALAERGVDPARVTSTGTARDAPAGATARSVDVQLSPGPAPAGQEKAS